MARFQRRHTITFAGILAAAVAITAWAHQQGFITWQLPAILGGSTAITQMAGGGMGQIAGASPENCASQLLDGKPPVLTNAKLETKTTELCYSGFAVLHSGITLTPLWSAEHLTAARIEAAHTLKRKNSFHPDPNLTADERAELADYKGYPYDRGHMAPNGDMPDTVSQEECFTLANMIPQDRDNNEHLWAHIEEAVRRLAKTDGDLYVVTGPIFDGDAINQINDRVYVPTKIYKAVYDVTRHQAAAYVVNNAPGDKYQSVTLADLETLTGIKTFPGLPADISQLELPSPAASELTN